MPFFGKQNVLLLSLDDWGDTTFRRFRELVHQEFRPAERTLVFEAADVAELVGAETYDRLLDQIQTLKEYDTLPLRVEICLSLTRAEEITKRLAAIAGVLRLLERRNTLSRVRIALYIMLTSDLEQYLGDAGETSEASVLFGLLEKLEHGALTAGGVDLNELRAFAADAIPPDEKNPRTIGRVMNEVYLLTVPADVDPYAPEEADRVAQKIFQELAHPELRLTRYRGYVDNLPVVLPDGGESRGRLPMYATFAVAAVQKPLNYLARYFKFESLLNFYDQYVLGGDFDIRELMGAKGEWRGRDDSRRLAMRRSELERLFSRLGFEATEEFSRVTPPESAAEQDQPLFSMDLSRMVEGCYHFEIRELFLEAWFERDPYNPDILTNIEEFEAVYEEFLKEFMARADVRARVDARIEYEFQALEEMLREEAEELGERCRRGLTFADLDGLLRDFAGTMLAWLRFDPEEYRALVAKAEKDLQYHSQPWSRRGAFEDLAPHTPAEQRVAPGSRSENETQADPSEGEADSPGGETKDEIADKEPEVDAKGEPEIAANASEAEDKGAESDVGKDGSEGVIKGVDEAATDDAEKDELEVVEEEDEHWTSVKDIPPKVARKIVRELSDELEKDPLRAQKRLKELARRAAEEAAAHDGNKTSDDGDVVNESDEAAGDETVPATEEEYRRGAGNIFEALIELEKEYRTQYLIHKRDFEDRMSFDLDRGIIKRVFLSIFFRRRMFMRNLEKFNFHSLLFGELSALMRERLQSFLETTHESRRSVWERTMRLCEQRRHVGAGGEPEDDGEVRAQGESPERITTFHEFTGVSEDAAGRDEELKAELNGYFLGPLLGARLDLSRFLARARRGRALAHGARTELENRRSYRFQVKYGFDEISDLRELYRRYFPDSRREDLAEFMGAVRSELVSELSADGPTAWDTLNGRLVAIIRARSADFIRRELHRPDADVHGSFKDFMHLTESEETALGETINRTLDLQLRGTIDFETFSDPRLPPPYRFQQVIDTSDILGGEQPRAPWSRVPMGQRDYPNDEPMRVIQDARYLDTYIFREVHRLRLRNLRKFTVLDG